MCANNDQERYRKIIQKIHRGSRGVWQAFSKLFDFMGERDTVHFIEQFAHPLIHLLRCSPYAVKPDLSFDLSDLSLIHISMCIRDSCN